MEIKLLSLEEELELEESLADHLRYNHIPPVTTKMVEPCKQAITAALNDEWHKMIEVVTEISALDIVKDLHLDRYTRYFIDRIDPSHSREKKRILRCFFKFEDEPRYVL